MLKKLVALTLGVGLFCSGGLCHAANIENHITDMKGTVTAVFLHKVTPNPTGHQDEWVLIDSPNKEISKTGGVVVANDININTIPNLTEGTYDAVAFEHTPFDVKGYIDVKDDSDDRINGRYRSTAEATKFVKENGLEEFFKDNEALSSDETKKFWENVMNNQVGSIYSGDNPGRIITAQKLSKPVIITEEINAQGKKDKYANIDSFDYTVRATGLWAGKGWPGYKGKAHYDPLNGEFKFNDDHTKGTLTYGDGDSYLWELTMDGKHTLKPSFIDNIEIEEPETK